MRELLKRTWTEISLDNIEHNYNAIRAKLPPGCRFMGVVKADAYGHGAVAVGRLLEELGAEYLAVSSLDEAMQLRDAGIKMPVLVLGYTPVEFTDVLIENSLTQTITDPDIALGFSKAAQELGEKLRAHIKVDTGMSRLGFVYDENHGGAAAEIARAAKLPGLECEGIFTHFAVSDADGEEYTRLQSDRFMELIELLGQKFDTHFTIRHCANSGAVVNYPYTYLDMVRPGLALYGMYPAQGMEGLVELRPAMQLKTLVIQTKELESGVTVSYGRTFKTECRSRIAVIPVGYADGFMRAFSNNLEVLVRGKRARIAGKVCMDMSMIDVTDIPEVRTGDVVTVFGRDGDKFLPIEEAARAAGTISYEIACAIDKRVLRIYYRGGRECGYMNYLFD